MASEVHVEPFQDENLLKKLHRNGKGVVLSTLKIFISSIRRFAPCERILEITRLVLFGLRDLDQPRYADPESAVLPLDDPQWHGGAVLHARYFKTPFIQ